MPNEQGGIVDDLLVYMLKDDEYMLVVNASNIEKDWDWLNSHNSMGAITENISEDISILAVQGPDAEKVLQKITSADLSKIPFYGFTRGNIGDITDGVVISATGYTGSGGFELYMYNQYAAQIWEALMEAGKEYGIKPAGLGARDTLRLEMGYCLYGNDISDTTSPIEAGLSWITSLNKSFIGRDIFKQQKESGVKKKLCGFSMLERGIPRHGYVLLNSKDEEIGEVTSGTMSPSLNMGIGMGYVKTEYAQAGEIIQVSVRNKKIPAKITKLPFYKP
jgi:aminomethyltransferase